MTFVYIVRCNFTVPAKEQAWNHWYGGPKIAQMLRNPLFLTCQRFQRAAGSGRNYLALWTVRSPEAFRTAEYTAQWGFAEWAPYITDWSRDLFDAGATPESRFAVASDGALQVVAFDGLSQAAADAARAVGAPSAPGMMWLPVAGLDRHTPVIGLEPRPDRTASADRGSAAGMQHAIYRPISAFHVANKENERLSQAAR